MKTRLSPIAARRDLTDRECSKILGGTIGGLCEMADIETVQRAVKWWAEETAFWNTIAAYQKQRKATE